MKRILRKYTELWLHAQDKSCYSFCSSLQLRQENYEQNIFMKKLYILPILLYLCAQSVTYSKLKSTPSGVFLNLVVVCWAKREPSFTCLFQLFAVVVKPFRFVSVELSVAVE